MSDSEIPIPDPHGARQPPAPPARTAVGAATPEPADWPDLALIVPAGRRLVRTREGLGAAVGLGLGAVGAFIGAWLTRDAGRVGLLVPTLLALAGAGAGIALMRSGVRTLPPPGP